MWWLMNWWIQLIDHALCLFLPLSLNPIHQLQCIRFICGESSREWTVAIRQCTTVGPLTRCGLTNRQIILRNVLNGNLLFICRWVSWVSLGDKYICYFVCCSVTRSLERSKCLFREWYESSHFPFQLRERLNAFYMFAFTCNGTRPTNLSTKKWKKINWRKKRKQ